MNADPPDQGAGIPEKVEDSSAESFEALLEEYDHQQTRRGQTLEGEIIRVDEDVILLDVGAKRDALVPRKELEQLDSEWLDDLSRGDRMPVYVLESPAYGGGDLIVSIRRGLEQEDWDRAEKHLESGETVDLTVTGSNRGGVVVRYGRVRGFVPNSHIAGFDRSQSDDQRDEQKEAMMGDVLPLKVLEVDRQRERLILTGRAATQDHRFQRLNELSEDDVIKGTVVNLVSFGAFIDLGGVDGLIHISELEWSRVDHPSQVLTLSDEVEVKIIAIDRDRQRVSLSRKALLPNPWENFGDQHEAGDILKGVITNVRDFGAFVMLEEEGIEGLIHASQLDESGEITPENLLRQGDKVETEILEIDTERERVSLSLKPEEIERLLSRSPEDDIDEPELEEESVEDEVEQAEDFDQDLIEEEVEEAEALEEAASEEDEEELEEETIEDEVEEAEALEEAASEEDEEELEEESVEGEAVIEEDEEDQTVEEAETADS